METQLTISTEFTRHRLEKEIDVLKAKSESLEERLKTGRTVITVMWKELDANPSNTEKLAEVERTEDYWLLLWRKYRGINLKIKALNMNLID